MTNSMESYFITEKFTIAPKPLYKEEYVREMFEVAENEVVKTLELEKCNALLSFIAQKDDNGENLVPLAYVLIKYAATIQDHNKIVINYNKGEKLTHIIAMEGEKLILANTYRTTDVKSVLYFISLVAQQVMFNPHLTKVHIYGELEEEGVQLIEKYFAGVA